MARKINDLTTNFTVHFAKEEKGKVFWPKVGAAFLKDDQSRIDIRLDSIPIQPWDGRLFLYPSEKRDEK